MLASDRERRWLIDEVKRLESETEIVEMLEAKAELEENGENSDENSDYNNEEEPDFLHYGLKDLYERLREIEAVN